jgi:hypothetical protein
MNRLQKEKGMGMGRLKNIHATRGRWASVDPSGVSKKNWWATLAIHRNGKSISKAIF